MKRRILGVVLTLALCLSMLPSAAFAADGGGNSDVDVSTTGLKLELESNMPIGKTVYQAGEGTITVDRTDDGATLTLELNNATINTSSDRGIDCDSFFGTDISNVIVTLIGANSITAAQCGLRFGQGQKESGTLISIQGDGSLQIAANDRGIRTCRDAVTTHTVGGRTNLEFMSGSITVTGAVDGFWAANSNVTIGGTAEVTFEDCGDEGVTSTGHQVMFPLIPNLWSRTAGN